MKTGLRIGELAELVGVKPGTVRYYESLGLMPNPARRANGYRRYTSDDAARLRFIVQAKACGLQLDDIREILDVTSSGQAPCECVRERASARLRVIEEQIVSLEALRDRLASVADREGERSDRVFSVAICPLIETHSSATP